MKTLDITILEDHHGLAESVGDFFRPIDCIEEILVREGRMKHREHGECWCFFAATKMTGSLHYILLSKKSRFDKAWCREEELCSGEFANLIIQKFNLVFK